MDAQEQNLCLLNMPVLVLEKILANIHNPSNVSRSCKYLYEIVCGMEKARRVMCISAVDKASRLNIDDDAILDSIMNSYRTINEIELLLESVESDHSYVLNKRQLKRITAILKQFGANVTSLKCHGFVLQVGVILEWFQQVTNLESLSFSNGKVVASLPENTTTPFQLQRLTALEIIDFPGLVDIVNLIRAGSLNSVHLTSEPTKLTERLTTIPTKQHNIKSLSLVIYSNSNLTNVCADHLQLDFLTLRSYGLYDDSQLMEILKCQTNLKELRLQLFYLALSGSAFQWICNNLQKLEVLEVAELGRIAGNDFGMLGELKRLRHFRVHNTYQLFNNGLGFPFKSDSIQKLDIGGMSVFGCGKRLNKMLNSMVHHLPNLTCLTMKFANFSALSCVLRHCTKIIHLKSYIRDPIPDQLTNQRFPNIQTLEVFHCSNNPSCETIHCLMTLIVRAMPNLKSMSLSTFYGFLFDVDTMREFVKESKSLDYFYVDRFELNRELPADDVVETLRCLTDQLKGYHINFKPSTSAEDLNFHKIKDALSNEFYVRDSFWNPPSFCLYKGGVKKFHKFNF